MPSLVSLETVRTLNPATFLTTEKGEPKHDHPKVTDEIYVSLPNQQDQGIKNTELMLFNDGSCYLQEGTQKEGYAVTTTT